MQFVLSETDDVLVSHSGLALVGALLRRTQLLARLDALEVAACRRPAMPHGEVLLSMIGLLALGKSDYAGYAPVFAYLGQEGYLLDCELRPGNQHVQKGPSFWAARFGTLGK